MISTGQFSSQRKPFSLHANLSKWSGSGDSFHLFLSDGSDIVPVAKLEGGFVQIKDANDNWASVDGYS
jgi:hypothetical protein